VGGQRAGVRAAERDEGVDIRAAAHALDVVARDHPAERVTHDVDLVDTGPLAQLIHVLAQLVGGRADVAGEEAVVHGVHGAEPAPVQRAPEDREDRAVVHDPVDQQDRRAGRLHIGDHEAAPHRRQRIGAVAGGVV
jgi:hypothetical protein